MSNTAFIAEICYILCLSIGKQTARSTATGVTAVTWNSDLQGHRTLRYSSCTLLGMIKQIKVEDSVTTEKDCTVVSVSKNSLCFRVYQPNYSKIIIDNYYKSSTKEHTH